MICWESNLEPKVFQRKSLNGALEEALPTIYIDCICLGVVWSPACSTTLASALFFQYLSNQLLHWLTLDHSCFSFTFLFDSFLHFFRLLFLLYHLGVLLPSSLLLLFEH